MKTLFLLWSRRESAAFAIITVFVIFFTQALVVQAQQKASFNLAKMLYADADYDGALRVVSKLIAEGDTSSSEVFRLAGLLYIAQSSYTRASEVLERSLRLDSLSIPTWRALAQAEKESGNVEAARIALQRALHLDTTNTTTLSRYAALCVEQEDFATAVSALERHAAIEPRNGIVRLQLARASAAMVERGEGGEGAKKLARENYLLALDLAPKNRQYRQEASRYFVLAEDYLTALGTVQRGLLMYPDDDVLWRRKATIHNRLDQPREAIVAYLRCLALGDSAFSVFRELGVMYCLLQRFDSARQYLLIAAQNGVSAEIDPRTTSFLALASRELGLYDEAVQWYDRTLTALRRGQFSSILGQIGLTHRKALAREKAFEYYRLALTIDSASADARYELATLYDDEFQHIAKTDARASMQARAHAVFYFTQFLQRSSNETLPTVRHAVHRLTELGAPVPQLRTSASVRIETSSQQPSATAATVSTNSTITNTRTMLLLDSSGSIIRTFGDDEDSTMLRKHISPSSKQDSARNHHNIP